MRCLKCALLGGAALLLLAPGFARAAFFGIDDTRTDDNILFSANDFELGITVDGVLLQSGLGSPGSLLLPEADPTGQPIRHTFHGTWEADFATLPGPIQVAFIEPGPVPGPISDILFAQYAAAGGFFGTIDGYFISDASETGLDPLQYLTPGVPVINWPESNGTFDFSAPFLTALATSDAADVPEPASCVLMALGLGVLFLRRPSRRGSLRG